MAFLCAGTVLRGEIKPSGGEVSTNSANHCSTGLLGVALVHGAIATKANAPNLDGSSRSRHTNCGLLRATVDAQVSRFAPIHDPEQFVPP